MRAGGVEQSMQHRKIFQSMAFAALLVAAVPRAEAQYGAAGGIPGNASDIFSSAGDNSVQQRYNKARKGANITEWVRRLEDEDPDRRLEAVKSLGDSNDPKSVDYLIQAVGDGDPRVEAKAVWYLGKLHAADSTPFLIQKLFTVGTRQKLRHRILTALGQIGDPRASHPILQYVMQEENLDTRGAGLFAIGEIGDQSIREELKRFSEVEENALLRQLASEALIKIATRQTAPAPEKEGAFPNALEAALSTEKPQ